MDKKRQDQQSQGTQQGQRRQNQQGQSGQQQGTGNARRSEEDRQTNK